MVPRLWCTWALTLLAAMVAGEIAPKMVGSFVQERVWGSMGWTVALRFSPGNTHVFAAEKNGIIRVYNSMESPEWDYKTVLDLGSAVHTFHDHGLLGFNIHPEYPTVPFVYALFSANMHADLARTEKIWANPNQCPVDLFKQRMTTPPDTRLFCEASGRFIRIRVDQATLTGSIDQILLSDWCGSGPSHHVDDLVWAPDGSLYVSSGDGASFDGVDLGLPQDNCFIPGGPKLQGSFRSQDMGFLHGKVLRIFPAALLARRMLVKDQDYKIVSRGHRNPYRMAVQPSTGDLYLGDVGADWFEEINIVKNPLVGEASIPNYGWPCYEGITPPPPYEARNLEECRDLSFDQTVAPWYMYEHGFRLKVPDDESNLCEGRSASPTGVLFYSGHQFPADPWKETLIWLEGSKRCVLFFEKDASGKPDAGKLRTLVYTPDSLADGSGLKPGQYVDISMGPDGSIYLIDLMLSAVIRIRYIGPIAVGPPPPVPKFKVNTVGVDALQIALDGSGSGPDIARWEWGFNGVFELSSESSPLASKTFAEVPPGGIVEIILQVTNTAGVSASTTQQTIIGTKIKVMLSLNPSDLQWTYTDTIHVTASAVDNHGSVIPINDARWQATLKHCAYKHCSDVDIDFNNCQSHVLAVENKVPGNTAIARFQPIQSQMPSFISINVQIPHPTIPGLVGVGEIVTHPATIAVKLRSLPDPRLRISTCIRDASSCDLTVMVHGQTTLAVQEFQVIGTDAYAFDRWSSDDPSVIAMLTPTYMVTPDKDTNFIAEFSKIELKLLLSLPSPVLLTITGSPGLILATWSPVPDVDFYIVSCRSTVSNQFESIAVPSNSLNVRLHVPPRESNYEVTVSIIQGNTQGPPSPALLVSTSDTNSQDPNALILQQSTGLSMNYATCPGDYVLHSYLQKSAENLRDSDANSISAVQLVTVLIIATAWIFL